MIWKSLKIFYYFDSFFEQNSLKFLFLHLINPVLTMQLSFKNVIQCQKLVREKSFDLKENSEKNQGISFGKSCTNPDNIVHMFFIGGVTEKYIFFSLK